MGMFDELLRALKDRLLTPVARALGPGANPNVITMLAFVAGVAAAVAAAQRRVLAGLVLWLVNRFLDGLDGTVARVNQRQSDLGGYVDILLDFVVYAAVPIGLVLGFYSRDVALAGLLLMGTYFVNAASWMYLAGVLEKRSAGVAVSRELTTLRMPAAIVAGTETVIFFVLFLTFPTHLAALFGVMAALVCVGIVQRVVWARRHIGTRTT